MPKTYFDKFKFKIFHNDKFLTEIKSENCFRYECSPGKHLFWSVSENHEYLEAELEAGKTYIIQATVTMGVFKGRGFFTPVSYTDKERFEKTRTVIMTFPPFIPAEAIVTKMNEKLAKEIRECLQDYETKKKSGTMFNVLPSDMAVPEDLMK